MTFKISIIENINFLDRLNQDTFFYFNNYLDKCKIIDRLNYVISTGGKIFLVEKNDNITCFFTYRELSLLPAWSLSNLFIMDHNFFSPNILGFGYALDKAIELGEKNNRFSFLWVVEKSIYQRRSKIGLRSIKKRNSILNNYTFHIFHDSSIHKNFKFFDSLNGNLSENTYTILASRNIDTML